MSYGEENLREMMTEGMDFCGADRQSPFQDPLTPLSSDQNGQELSPDYMCSIIHQQEKVIENYQIELSYHLMYLRHNLMHPMYHYPSDADAHRSITTFLKKRVVNIRSHDNEIRVVNIDHRVANSAIY
ncbi:hypothetical protein CDAR_25071 [Caerostris darwini]|uniref:Uncharacterized protein n=1 Tax=Caerostris darwini TaxID=1538125 RepID=A0AAV4WXU0_9ARAC|nr:hypothetical protein CDAR_25071 [Caerostris darwini]